DVMTLYNTIVAGNIKPASSGSSPTTVAGSVNPARANNVIGNLVAGLTNGVNGNQLGVGNAGLGVLGNNGGPTDTVPLLPGSIAIDAGGNSLIPAGVTTDQRGDPRVADSTVDVGAYEVQPVASATTLKASPGPYQTGVATTLTATVTAPAGSPSPVGTVALYADNGLLGRNTLPAGQATFSVTFVTSGPHSFKAVFQGDGVHLSSPSSVLNLTVVQLYSPPVAQNDTASTTPDATVTVNVLANDSDPNSSPLTITDVSAPADGIAMIVNGQISYTPLTGFHATDTFTYQITDGHGLTATASVSVTVGSGIGVGTDPDNANLTDLDIVGTNNADNIAVNYAGAQGKATVVINNVNEGTFNFTGRILVFGMGGNDIITIDP